MTPSAWLLFITISLVTAFTPGPAVLLAMSNTFTACALASHVVYALLATRLQGWFSTPRRAQVFNRVTGGAFGLLGLGLLRLKNPV